MAVLFEGEPDKPHPVAVAFPPTVLSNLERRDAEAKESKKKPRARDSVSWPLEGGKELVRGYTGFSETVIADATEYNILEKCQHVIKKN